MRAPSSGVPAACMWAILLLVVIPGCEDKPPAGSPSSHEGQDSGEAGGVGEATAAGVPDHAVNLAYGPVEVFAGRCANCHGPEGAFYGSRFGDRDEETLHEIVAEMMKGPGRLDPTSPEIDAMVAYHLSLLQKAPYACVTNAFDFLSGRAEHLEGQLSPGATLTCTRGDQTVSAAVTGVKWSLADPPLPPFVVVVREAGVSKEFTFPESLWTP